MAQFEENLRQQYLTLIDTFHAEFPGIDPPASEWWIQWLDGYDFDDILTAIQSLGKHSLKLKFTTHSTGRAITAKLKEQALRRATSFTPPTGGSR